MDSLEIEICNRIRNGDEKAFYMLFRAYYSQLCRYAYEILNDRETSAELVNDLFIKLWTDREKLTITSSLKGYLFRSVHNLCLNRVRELKSTHRLQMISLDESDNRMLLLNLEIPPEIIEKLFSEQLETDLRNAIGNLPEQCRQIFNLSRFEDLSYPEIATKLNVSLSTVKTQMIRALTKLTKELKIDV